MSARIRFVAKGQHGVRIAGMQRWTAHPVFAWAGLRPVQAQHTEAEHEALGKFGRGRRSVVELGVAEGASAVAIRDVMDPGGTLYLVDPYHLSRIPALNFLQRAAHRAVGAKSGPKTVWLQEFSYEVADEWSMPIDFLFIDGDHREAAVEQDWRQWSPFLEPDGVAAFHDARVFSGGWTEEGHGPVRFVDRAFRKAEQCEWTILDEVDSLVVVGRGRPTSG
jgi:predicted O-methyltransferase YrrM